MQIAHFSFFESFPQNPVGSVENSVGNFLCFPYFRGFSTPSGVEFSTFSTISVWKTVFSQKDEILHLSLLTRKKGIFSHFFGFQKR